MRSYNFTHNIIFKFFLIIVFFSTFLTTFLSHQDASAVKVNTKAGAGASSGHGGGAQVKCNVPIPNKGGVKPDVLWQLCPNPSDGGGASWRIYEAESDSISVSGTNGGFVQGGTVTGCKSNGGFFLLHGAEGALGGSKEGRQVGMIPVKESRGVGSAKWYVNDAGGVSVSDDISKAAAELLTYGRGRNVSAGQGQRITWGSAQKIFKAVQDAADDNAEIIKYNFDNKSSLSWFCFDPQKFLQMNLGTKSHVKVDEKVKDGSKWSKINGKVHVEYTIPKEGDVATLTFTQYIMADITQIKDDPTKKYSIEFQTNFDDGFDKLNKSQASVKSVNGDAIVNSRSYSGAVTETSGWADSSEDISAFSGSKKVQKVTVKEITQLKIAYNDIPEGSSVKICENIRIPKNSVKFEDGKEPEYGGDMRSSQGCITIKRGKTKDPEPEPEPDFCKGIVDQNENFGNTAGLSYIINTSKGGNFPSKEQLFEENDSSEGVKGNIRMTQIVGGTGKKSGGAELNPYLFARPFDTIKFGHVMCFGSLAVKSLELKQAKSGQTDRRHNAKDVKFLFSSSPEGHIWSDVSSTMTFGINESGETIIGNATSVHKFGAWAESPSSDTGCNNAVGDGINAGGFQIPGIDGCSQGNDVGKIVAQTMSFDEVQAWVGDTDGTVTPGECACDKKRKEESPNFGSYDSAKSGSLNTEVVHHLCKKLEKQCDCHEYSCRKKCDDVPIYDEYGKIKELKQECYYQECTPDPKNEKDDCKEKCYKKCDNYAEGDKKYVFYPKKEDVKTRHTISVAARVPYNFILKFNGAPKFPAGREEIVYPGEVLPPIEIDAKVSPRLNSVVSNDGEYATITPKVTATYVKFLLPADADKSVVENLEGKTVPGGLDSGLCGAIGVSTQYTQYVCHDGNRKTIGRLNKEGLYAGTESERVPLDKLVVPDVDAGKKFCVVAAIYPADSHGYPDQQDVDPNDFEQDAALGGINKDKSWRLSKPACRTVVKKPNFQVWNGGILAQNIKTSLTDKIVGAKLSDGPSDATGRFGSWSEFETVATGSINNFASGASLGYGNSSNRLNSILPLPGGTSPSVDYNPNLIPQTISNTGGFVGNSGISADHTISDRLRARYTSLPISSGSIEDLKTLCRPNDTSAGCNKNGVKVIKTEDASMGTIELPIPAVENITDNFAPNTYVIFNEGYLKINGNICSGNCDNPEELKSIAQIPQLLIFADYIDIGKDVERLDAWLISKSTINTCVEFAQEQAKSASSDSDLNPPECAKQLSINGPVIIGNEDSSGYDKKILLYRTAGAYPGDGNTPKNPNRISNFSNAPTFDLTKDGSITPAEIFHLHPAAYLWAFNQSQRLTQAIVTHSRELPPRF